MAATMWKVMRKGSTNLTTFCSRLTQRGATIRARYTTVVKFEDEEKYFPPIPPYLTEEEKERENLRAQVNSVETAQEMIGILTKRQAWTYLPVSFNIQPNSQKCYQQITKTRIVEELPSSYFRADTSNVLEELLPVLVDCVEQEFCYMDRSQLKIKKYNKTSSLRGSWLQESLVRAIIASQCDNYQHLKTCELEIDTQVRSFWLRDNNRYQINQTPWCLLRTNDPLPEVIGQDHDLCVNTDIPDHKYSPRSMRIFRKHINNRCYPGHKLRDDKVSSGHTQVLVPKVFERQRSISEKLLDERLNGTGLIAGFGWANALAMSQKHFWFNDIQKPIVVQSIHTNDGQHYTFSVYQLNTIGLDPLSDKTNNICNVMWTSGEMKLFQEVSDNKIIGWNHDVFKHYVAFLLNETGPRTPMIDKAENTNEKLE
ncbi:large ribosomal subunit protein mL65-like [Glandiceps talaboti]